MAVEDTDYIRNLLNHWARWLCSGGGYSHRSSVEWINEGGSRTGTFGSSIPKDVEPSRPVARVSQAMQHLRLIDPNAAGLLAEIYLRKEKARLSDLAQQAGMGLTTYQDHRRTAERKLLSLFQALAVESITDVQQ